MTHGVENRYYPTLRRHPDHFGGHTRDPGSVWRPANPRLLFYKCPVSRNTTRM